MSWMHFWGRNLIFAVLVGLQIVPLQMTLIPISRLYAQLGLNGTFLGIWLFHTGFGLPYAIYLTRNFLGALPNELFEAAYMDGAGHWQVFWRMALPLSIPALASLAIFQFLWVWNDLLVALVFLGAQHPVLTYQISTLVSSLGCGLAVAHRRRLHFDDPADGRLLLDAALLRAWSAGRLGQRLIVIVILLAGAHGVRPNSKTYD